MKLIEQIYLLIALLIVPISLQAKFNDILEAKQTCYQEGRKNNFGTKRCPKGYKINSVTCICYKK